MFLKLEEIKSDNFHFVRLLFLSHITRKLYVVCKYYTYQMTTLLLDMTGELQSQNCPPVCKRFSFKHFFGFCLSVASMAHTVGHTQTTGCMHYKLR